MDCPAFSSSYDAAVEFVCGIMREAGFTVRVTEWAISWPDRRSDPSLSDPRRIPS